MISTLDADRDSVGAAAAAGVQLRELSALDELDQVYRLYDAIWRPDPNNPPVTTELLRALTKAGNYVGGAYDGDELIGACVGFFEAPAAVAMHSHVAGVSAAARGRNVGFALKLHQRAWALRRGVTAISWTFDPLIRRNAYFNVVKLGARPTEYLPNFYGQMEDGINDGDDTDRLLVRWQLDAPEVGAAAAGHPGRCRCRGLAWGNDRVGARRRTGGRCWVPGAMTGYCWSPYRVMSRGYAVRIPVSPRTGGWRCVRCSAGCLRTVRG